MLNEVSALRSGQANINRFDEAGVVFQVAAEDLPREFVRAQPSLRSDFRQLRFFFRLQANFHAYSLGRPVGAVK
jgi:hypothetical protein